MKILHVIPNLAARTGGPPVSVVQASLALRQCGVESTVFATDMAEAASAPSHARVSAAGLPAGASEIDVRLFRARWPRRLAFSPSMYAALAREADGYDIVHIHSLYLFPQFAASRQARLRQVPYVVSPRGALDPYLRRRSRTAKTIAGALWQRSLLEHASAMHLTSPEEARLVADVAPRVPRYVVPNGVRCGDYADLPSGDAFRARWGIDACSPLVMFLGRLSHKKGLDVLVRAFAAVHDAAPDARLAIVGPDDEALTPELSRLAGREGVGGSLTFTGMLQGGDKLSALAAADLWALPSHSENFGNAVVEALAAGRACVISRGVNISPEIEAAGAAVVCDPAVEGFASNMLALLRDRRRRDGLASRARAFAGRYDWSAVGPRLAAMYDDILRRN